MEVLFSLTCREQTDSMHSTHGSNRCALTTHWYPKSRLQDPPCWLELLFLTLLSTGHSATFLGALITFSYRWPRFFISLRRMSYSSVASLWIPVQSPACYHLVFEYLGPYSLRFETRSQPESKGGSSTVMHSMRLTWMVSHRGCRTVGARWFQLKLQYK